MIAFAPCCSAWSIISAKASLRVFSHRLVRIVMLPPTSVCRLAPRVPKTDRERTMMPRTTPRFLTILYPGSSSAVVTMEASSGMSCSFTGAARKKLHAGKRDYRTSLRRRLLLGHAVQRSQAPDEIAAVDAADDVLREEFGEDGERLAVVGIVKGWDQDDAIRDVEVGITRR